MAERRDHNWYREEAERLRQKAESCLGDDGLRDRYLALAQEYDLDRKSVV